MMDKNWRVVIGAFRRLLTSEECIQLDTMARGVGVPSLDLSCRTYWFVCESDARTLAVYATDTLGLLMAMDHGVDPTQPYTLEGKKVGDK